MRIVGKRGFFGCLFGKQRYPGECCFGHAWLFVYSLQDVWTKRPSTVIVGWPFGRRANMMRP